MKTPGFIIHNDTIWPLQISLNQVGPLYFDVIQPGEVFRRDTGAVWFTLKASIFLDEKDRITDWDAVFPIAAVVGTVVLAAVSAGSAAYAGGPALAAAGAAGVAGVNGLSAASALATATAASTLVGAGFSASAALVIGGAVVGGGAGAALSATATRALQGIFSPGNVSVSKAGCYAGPPWPFREDLEPWTVSGGPTFRRVPDSNEDQVEPIGGRLVLKRGGPELRPPKVHKQRMISVKADDTRLYNEHEVVEDPKNWTPQDPNEVIVCCEKLDYNKSGGTYFFNRQFVIEEYPDRRGEFSRIRHQNFGYLCERSDGFISHQRDRTGERSKFIIEDLGNDYVRIRAKASGKYLHANGRGDKKISTRYQPNDDYTKFRLLHEPWSKSSSS